MIDKFFESLQSEGFVYSNNEYSRKEGNYIETYSRSEKDDEVIHRLIEHSGAIYREETITLTF